MFAGVVYILENHVRKGVNPRGKSKLVQGLSAIVVLKSAIRKLQSFQTISSEME
jgi:hypothetical protein